MKSVPFEYFCNSCGQLRMSYIPDNNLCRNCGSANISKGELGELDKDKLKNDFKIYQREIKDV